PAGWLICSNRWQPLSMLSAARSCRRWRFGAAGDEAECEPVRRDGMAYEVGADGLAGPQRNAIGASVVRLGRSTCGAQRRLRPAAYDPKETRAAEQDALLIVRYFNARPS